MRRRIPDDVDTMPVKLRHYNPADWPHGCHPECEYWRAYNEWSDTHPDDRTREWPDVISAGPDTPFHPELV